ncbi:MAG: hypothetical protein II185_04000 [Firmicutes bacterium]|nr:hypothetical protein [Bacillota bacterium]
MENTQNFEKKRNLILFIIAIVCIIGIVVAVFTFKTKRIVKWSTLDSATELRYTDASGTTYTLKNSDESFVKIRDELKKVKGKKDASITVTSGYEIVVVTPDEEIRIVWGDSGVKVGDDCWRVNTYIPWDWIEELFKE